MKSGCKERKKCLISLYGLSKNNCFYHSGYLLPLARMQSEKNKLENFERIQVIMCWAYYVLQFCLYRRICCGLIQSFKEKLQNLNISVFFILPYVRNGIMVLSIWSENPDSIWIVSVYYPDSIRILSDT